MFAQIAMGGFLIVVIMYVVTYMIRGFKHGTQDSDPEKHKVLRWFYGGKHPQQKFYKNMVNETVKHEEEIDAAIEENSKDK